MPKLLEPQYDATISVASTAIMILVVNYAGRPTEIAIAYLVCDAFGLETDLYSFPYVTSWSGGEVKTVTAAAEVAIRCAAEIVEALDAMEIGPELHLLGDTVSDEIMDEPIHHGYEIVQRFELSESAWNGGRDGGEYKAAMLRALDLAEQLT